MKRLTDQRDKLLGALLSALSPTATSPKLVAGSQLTMFRDGCLSSRAAEIEEINTTNAEEVAKLENGTKEQEELNTKNHDAAVRCTAGHYIRLLLEPCDAAAVLDFVPIRCPGGEAHQRVRYAANKTGRDGG